MKPPLGGFSFGALHANPAKGKERYWQIYQKNSKETSDISDCQVRQNVVY